ncbi:MAG: DUF3833 domain-containing protein [Ferrovibrio sp.]|uniref:DUF3833 domain-containing protein n=1 Tax=Ferrovibrio sp. TaxID=1917215 RepID=UPI00391A5800
MRRLLHLFAPLFLLALAACGTDRPDPAGQAAYGPFELERYFTGKVKAWGLFEPRFGGAVRQFTVEIRGSRDGDALVLDEDFRFSDGEIQKRIWRIRPDGTGRYTGTADDVLGVAQGYSRGNALAWAYDLRLKTQSGSIDVGFDDWLYRFDDEIVLNRATVTKWGLPVGSVTLAFRKIE